MRKITSLLVGMVLGATVATLGVLLLSPVSGAAFRARWREQLQRARAAAQQAQAAKRAELEAMLKGE